MIPQRYKKRIALYASSHYFAVFQPVKERRGRDFYPPILTVGHPTAIVPPGALAQVVRLFPAGDASVRSCTKMRGVKRKNDFHFALSS